MKNSLIIGAMSVAFVGVINFLGERKVIDETGTENILTNYTNDILNAVQILEKDSVLIASTVSKNFRREILSIGFPEVIRWNEFSDVIEIETDRLLYVKYGQNYANFSIGIFQMKPSFVESLEEYYDSFLPTSQKLMFNNIILDKASDIENREARIKRLEDRSWQLRYLELYWYVASHKFRCLKFTKQEERVAFYAAAYNYGYTKPINEIIDWQSRRVFPFGKKYNRQQMSYSDFSTAFYTLYSKHFFQL